MTGKPTSSANATALDGCGDDAAGDFLADALHGLLEQLAVFRRLMEAATCPKLMKLIHYAVSASSTAMLRPVCPPSVAMMPCGRSLPYGGYRVQRDGLDVYAVRHLASVMMVAGWS